MVYAAMMAAVGLSALNGSTVSTALTTIISDIGGIKAYTWVSTSYLLTSTAATPLFGKFSDLYGRKRFTQFAIVIFLVGSLLCSLAQNMGMLVFARAVQGIGSGGAMAMSFIVIADIVPPRERGRYVGAFTSIFALSSVAGPLIGGLIVDNTSWRWIFVVNMPFGVFALWMTQRHLRLPVIRRDTSIDTVGALLLVSGVATLILALSWSPGQFGWGSAQTTGMIAASVALVAVFLWWEPRVTNPIVPMHLFRNHTVQVMVPMVTLISAAMTTVSTFMPLFLQAVTGVSPTNSGLLLVPMMIGMTAASTYVGKRITATGHYRVWPIAGAVLGSAGMVLVSFIDNSGTRIAISLFGMALMGLCVGGTMPTSTTAIQNSVAVRDLGVASSLSQLCRNLGSTIAVAAYGAVLNLQLEGRVDPKLLRAPRTINKLPEPGRGQALDAISHGITTVFRWAIPMLMVALVLTVMVRELPLRQHAAFEDASVNEDAQAPSAGD
ncbi:MAG: MFS transporter [Actinobacteria bacterium]|nr:MFS transporter [Actinomycetota bacterium]NBR67552.1 MFS transporter [Actinomycetota bacterium]NBU15568.1 MFS transporter [Actinomycetota bacterium]